MFKINSYFDPGVYQSLIEIGDLISLTEDGKLCIGYVLAVEDRSEFPDRPQVALIKWMDLDITEWNEMNYLHDRIFDKKHWKLIKCKQ